MDLAATVAATRRPVNGRKAGHRPAMPANLAQSLHIDTALINYRPNQEAGPDPSTRDEPATDCTNGARLHSLGNTEQYPSSQRTLWRPAPRRLRCTVQRVQQ